MERSQKFNMKITEYKEQKDCFKLESEIIELHNKEHERLTEAYELAKFALQGKGFSFFELSKDFNRLSNSLNPSLVFAKDKFS